MSTSEPPRGMAVVLDHDGVLWTIPTRGRRNLMAGVVVALGAGVNGLIQATAPLWSLAAVGIISVSIALYTLVSGRHAYQAELRPDRVWLTERGVRTEVLLRDIERLQVVDRGSIEMPHALLSIQTPAERVLFGRGLPKAHLEWFVSAIHVAKGHLDTVDHKQGHELFFHRERPKALEKLID